MVKRIKCKNIFMTKQTRGGDTVGSACQLQLEEQKRSNDALKSELELLRERNRYLAADFDNFKRRSYDDCQRLVEAAQIAILRDILPLVDDFDRAFAEIEHKPELGPYLSGFELTYKSLQKLLSRHNVSEIKDISVFNPEFHEAVMQVDDPAKRSGEIVTVLQKGYLYRGKLLRPAHVSVRP